MGQPVNARAASSRQRRTIVSGIARENSDDELGVDDLPWEWIYEAPEGTTPSDASEVILPGKKRRRDGGRQIVGARMGNFQCYIGDSVLLKADGSNEAWVAIICEFFDDGDNEEEKAANFMWFSTEREIRKHDKKRLDFHPNELYISPSWDTNPLAAINGKATVLSLKAFLQRYPSGKIPRSSADHGKLFICRRGCNTRTATYTEEFVWEDVYRGDVFRLIEYVEAQTKATRKQRTTREVSADKPYIADDNDEGINSHKHTPEKHASTAQSKQKGASTPSSRKRIMVRKKLEFTPLATRKLSQTGIQSSPFQLARSQLHVASVPSSLPCRESEFTLVYSHLEAAIVDGSGSCIYIAGTPGTGKTATVREVISRLEDAVRTDDLDDFIFVEINGMKITDPHQSYALLWEALKGERVSPTQALDLLEHEFNNPSPRRIPCVVLMDELDQLVTRNQSVMYNFFNWPALRHSRLIVLAVANTMDLPERTLSNKISSRIGLTRITFPGYNHEQLMKIIQSRLEGIPGNIVESDAIQFASRKVAAVSGDARRALDICRRAVELAEADDGADSGTPSKKGRKSGQEVSDGTRFHNKVTISTIKRAIQEATTNPIQQYLRSLAFGPKLLLVALLVRAQRNGTPETTFGDVVDETRRIMKLETGSLQPGILGGLGYSFIFGSTGNDKEDVRATEALGLQTAARDLTGAGILVLEGHKPERPSKMRLAVGDEEIRMAFRDDIDVKALGLVL